MYAERHQPVFLLPSVGKQTGNSIATKILRINALLHEKGIYNAGEDQHLVLS